MKYMALLLLFIAQSSFAEESIILSVGFGLGGAAIAKKENDASVIDIQDELAAGNGYQQELGYQHDYSDKLALCYLVAYKRYSLNFENSTHTIESYPLSALLLYRFNAITLGGGLTYHINPRYTARGDYNDTAEFDNALGVSSVLNFQLTRSDLFSIQIRHTYIKYRGANTPEGNTASTFTRTRSKYNASNLAVFAVFRFRSF